MLSVKGIYDGERIKFAVEIKIIKPVRVIVTFLDETLQDENVFKDIYVSAENGAFSFLKEPQEEIYSDKNLVVKYKK